MSRTQSRNNSSSVSLFPFLAVLLCTMGGLVVLLVAVSHVSREAAKREKAKAEATAAAADEEPPIEDAEELLAELKRRAAEYTEREADAKRTLQEDQLRIAQVEQHIRKLQDEMTLIQMEQLELEEDSTQRYDDHAQAERELARLRLLIDDAKQELAELEQQLEGQRKSYSVVPYKGPNGTRRQPIYIECRGDKVLLQPEGVELVESDFAPPLGVGNPLAAALRAARDHLMSMTPGAGGDPDAEPYPLILVRPDGIMAYMSVRNAIRSWDSDFGYELIDSDWELSFAPPDAELAHAELRAIDVARLRRRALADAAPTAFAGGAGAFEVPAEAYDMAGDAPYDPGILGGEPGGQGGADGSNGYVDSGGDSGQRAVGRSAGVDAAYDPAAGQHAGGAGGHSRQPHGQASESGLTTTTAQAGQPGQGASGAASQGGASANSGMNSVSGNVASATVGSGGGAGGAASLNDKKGPDDVAIRRGVIVSVFADRLLVGNQPLPMSGPTTAHMNEFVSRVKKQIDSWGLAGNGLYWRPVIKLDVRHGGEQRAAEIERMLKRAGVDTEPVQTAARPNQEAPRATW